LLQIINICKHIEFYFSFGFQEIPGMISIS